MTSVHYSLFALLIVYSSLAVFNLPSADDFWYARHCIEQGIWECQGYFYQTWSGRYTSTFLLSVSPVSLLSPFSTASLLVYKILAAFNLLALGLGFYLFLKSVLFRFCQSDARTLSLISVSCLLVFLSRMPSTSEGVFWYAGYVNYTLPLTLLLWGGYLWLRSQTLQASGLLALAPLAIVISGSNEVMLVQLVGGLAVSLALSFLFFRKYLWPLAFLFTLSILCFAVVYFAPGNSVRSSHFSPPPLPLSILKSTLGTLEHVLVFLIHPSVFFLALLIFGLFDSGRITLRWSPKSPLRWGFLGLFALLNLGFLPAYVSMGGSPSGRVDNVLYAQFLIGLSVLLCLMTSQTGRLHSFLRQRHLTKFALLGVAISAWLSPQSIQMLLDFPRAISFHRQHLERLDAIESAESDSVVFGESTAPQPKSLIFSTLQTDSPNEDFAKVHGIKEVRLLKSY